MNNQYNLTYETDLNQGLASTTLPMLFLYDDSLAHVFTIKTTRDGKPNSLSGSTVHAYFMPSNSEECVYMAGTVDENGYAVVTLEPACYAFIGRFSLVIRAEKGSAVTSIFRGEGYVGQSHTDAILDPGEALPSLKEMEARIDAINTALASGLVSQSYTASNDAQIDAILKTVLTAMGGLTKRTFTLYLDSGANTFGGGTWFVTANKVSNDYATFSAESYMGGAIVDRYSKTVYGGTYNAWVPDDPAAFAPAGYGLGEATSPVINDFNVTLKGGPCTFGSGTLNRPSRIEEGVALVIPRTGTAIVQIACSTYDYYSGRGIFCVRQTVDGGTTWSEWEYVNPPMMLGVEYRTTERWNGRPVFTKAINCGALGQNTADDVYHDTPYIEVVWVSGGYWTDGTTRFSIPYIGGPDDNHVFASAYGGAIHRSYKGSSYNVADMTVVIKYTKSTD